MRMNPRTGLRFLAVVACCAMLLGCESGDDDDEPQVRVGNYSSGTVIILVDDAELGNVVPARRRITQ